MSHFRIVSLVGLLGLFCGEISEAKLSLTDIKNHRESEILALTRDGIFPDGARENLRVTFRAYRRTFELELAPSSIVDEQTKTYIVDDEGYHEISRPNRSFVGRVAGEEDSDVRVTLSGGALLGVVRINETFYAIEPRSDFDQAAPSGSVIVYRSSENPFVSFPDGDEEQAGDELGLAANLAITLERLKSSGITAIPDRPAPNWVYTAGELRRHSMGLIGDLAFYQSQNKVCSGDTSFGCAVDTDCSALGKGTCTVPDANRALDDMEDAINAADLAFRNTIPVGLRISSMVLFTTSAAQAGSQLKSCPLLCLTTGGSPSPGNVCTTNSECAAGSSCRFSNKLNFCQNANSLNGKLCAGNADCGGGSATCDGDPQNATVCIDGPQDGKLCQKSPNCSAYGNCCSLGDDACRDPGARARIAAGKYRIAPKACVGGTTDGYLCSVNADCQSPGTCTGLPKINTKNSGAIHIYTGCSIFLGAGSQPLCTTSQAADLDVRSCSITQHNNAGWTALERRGVFVHEVGHTFGGKHDHQSECEGLELAIEPDVCAIGGPREYLMCDAHTECQKGCTGGPTPGIVCSINADCGVGGTCTSAPTALCNKQNKRVCNGTSTICVDDSDCAVGVSCLGPANRLCVGGSKAGKICNTAYSGMCPGGSCTGAPMNWDLYGLGGSGLRGYSPCSQVSINNYLDGNPTCLHGLVCGDLNKSGGSYCVGGSEPNSACTANSDCAGAGTCTKVCSTGGTSSGWPCTTNSDCSGGSCGYSYPITAVDALIAQSHACASIYDDLGDVYPVFPPENPDGAITSCDGTSGDVDYLLDAAVRIVDAPVLCGIDDEPWW